MKYVHCLLLAAVASVLNSCGRSQLSLGVCIAEWSERNSQMYQAYLQTNINVAEAGLLSYRSWLTNRMNDPRYQAMAEGFPGYLLHTEGRLWALYEFRGDTNSSEHAYERAREVSRLDYRWARAPIAKTELSNLVNCCDGRADVPWKDTSNGQRH